jgi:hypothetical protein
MRLNITIVAVMIMIVATALLGYLVIGKMEWGNGYYHLH